MFDASVISKNRYQIFYLGNSIYKGEINSKGQPHGRGVMIYHDGSINEGHWQKACREGQNFYKTLDGSTLVGEFKNDIPDGKCTEKISDGTIYYGPIKKGLKNGLGNLLFANGDRFGGHFKNGNMSNGQYDSKT